MEMGVVTEKERPTEGAGKQRTVFGVGPRAGEVDCLAGQDVTRDTRSSKFPMVGDRKPGISISCRRRRRLRTVRKLERSTMRSGIRGTSRHPHP